MFFLTKNISTGCPRMNASILQPYNGHNHMWFVVLFPNDITRKVQNLSYKKKLNIYHNLKWFYIHLNKSEKLWHYCSNRSLHRMNASILQPNNGLNCMCFVIRFPNYIIRKVQNLSYKKNQTFITILTGFISI